MLGFSLLWCSMVGLLFSFIGILCIQMKGLIPLRSSMVYLIDLLWVLSFPKRFSCSAKFRLAFKMIGYLELESKNAYLSEEGRGFNSTSFVSF